MTGLLGRLLMACPNILVEKYVEQLLSLIVGKGSNCFPI